MGWMAVSGQWLSPDRFVLFGLLLAILVANPLNFIKDWIPFILLLLSYEFMRGLVPHLTSQVNIYPLINADKFLFAGYLPTVELQKLFYIPGRVQIHDLFFTTIYILHFALPLMFAFVLWIKKRQYFRNFAIALLVLSYAGFITYFLYPAMPPWMASDQGIIPHVYNIFNISSDQFFQSPSLPSVYRLFGPNQVAAMPSLHAAYPALVLLYFIKYFGKRGWFFFPYAASVWFAIIYLGHHYVIDALMGILYAVLAFIFVEWLFAVRDKKRVGYRGETPKKISAAED